MHETNKILLNIRALKLQPKQGIKTKYMYLQKQQIYQRADGRQSPSSCLHNNT